MASNKETKGIRVALILEILGKPPEHLVESLEGLIKKIDEEKGVVVINKKIKEPVPIKEEKEFYTTFAEVEIEVEGIMNLVIVMFKYMPAHIEIISPELIALANQGWSDILSELTRRLHGYDEIARVLNFEKKILEKKLEEALGKTPKKEEEAETKEKKSEKKLKEKKKSRGKN